MTQKSSAALLFLTFLAIPTVCSAEVIPFDAEDWEYRGQQQEFVEYKGKSAIKLTNSAANLPNLTFSTGTIEYDILTMGERGFSGVKWHIQDNGNTYENFYIRPHQSGNEDANQYNPVFNGVAAWQLMFSPYYSSPEVYEVNEWMHIKVEVFEDSADVYIDSETPSLRIRDLKGDFKSGTLGISSGFAPAYFANFSVSHTPPIKMSEPEAETFDLPEGLIESFAISSAFSEADIDQYLTEEARNNLTWEIGQVETNGILNIARYRAYKEGTNTVLIRIKASDYVANGGRLLFGYSDRIKVFQNDKAIYQGDNTYMTRDYRYLGTVGLFDSVIVSSEMADDDLYFAVSESFGGWGFMAAMPTFPTTPPM